MKRIFVFLLVFGIFISNLFAGGIVTNTNQSCSWIRMLARDASTDIDAVYYNPAGVMELPNGLHLSFNNQTIIQKREIKNEYPLLNDKTYKGDVFIPSIPTAFFTYKQDKWAVSGGFTIVGGGGGADYKTGLPSFEIPISNLKSLLTPLGVTAYKTNISFEGASTYFGFQLGGAYKINEMISAAAGVRYVYAINTYKGHIKDIQVNPANNWMRADKFLNDVAAQCDAGSAQYAAGAQQAQQAIDSYTQVGLTDSVAKYTAMKQFLLGEKAKLDAQSTMMRGNAAQLGDKEVDVTQTGTGICPYLGLNLLLLEKKLNVGLKYEFITKMKVENDTKKDDVKMFPDGEKTASDVPALLSVGVSYQWLPNFKTSLGFHYYFDKDADYGKKDSIHTGNDYFIEDNAYEIAAGIEFLPSEKLTLSVGYLYASMGAAMAFQTDLSYSLSSHSFGFGGMYKVSDRFNIELGIFYTNYTDGEKTISYGNNLNVKETYYKNNVVGSIGLTYRFFGN